MITKNENSAPPLGVEVEAETAGNMTTKAEKDSNSSKKGDKDTSKAKKAKNGKVSKQKTKQPKRPKVEMYDVSIRSMTSDEHPPLWTSKVPY